MEDQGRSKRPHEDDHDEGNGEHVEGLKRRRGDGPHIELRVLLASKNAGAIIGKGGATIKRLRNDYKASVTVPDSSSPERILTVGASLGTCCEILLDVIPALEEYQEYKDLNFDAELRLLVHQSQAGCIIGRAGFKIKELREETGAVIKVFSVCAPQSTERIVTVKGTPKVCVNAVATIYDLIQTAPPKGYSSPYDPHNYDEYMVAEYGGFEPGSGGRGGGGGRGGRGDFGGREDRGYGGGRGGRGGRDFGGGRRDGFGGGMRGGRGGMGMGGRGGRDGGFGGGRMGGGMRGGRGGRGGGRDYGGSMGGSGGGSSFGNGNSGNGDGIMGLMKDFTDDVSSDPQGGLFGGAQTTQVSIPKELAGAIIGKGGSRIRQIRHEAGANITIDEAQQGSNDRIITITGNNEQIQNAQFLLQQSVKEYSGQY